MHAQYNIGQKQPRTTDWCDKVQRSSCNAFAIATFSSFIIQNRRMPIIGTMSFNAKIIYKSEVALNSQHIVRKRVQKRVNKAFIHVLQTVFKPSILNLFK